MLTAKLPASTIGAEIVWVPLRTAILPLVERVAAAAADRVARQRAAGAQVQRAQDNRHIEATVEAVPVPSKAAVSVLNPLNVPGAAFTPLASVQLPLPLQSEPLLLVQRPLPLKTFTVALVKVPADAAPPMVALVALATVELRVKMPAVLDAKVWLPEFVAPGAKVPPLGSVPPESVPPEAFSVRLL